MIGHDQVPTYASQIWLPKAIPIAAPANMNGPNGIPLRRPARFVAIKMIPTTPPSKNAEKAPTTSGPHPSQPSAMSEDAREFDVAEAHSAGIDQSCDEVEAEQNGTADRRGREWPPLPCDRTFDREQHGQNRHTRAARERREGDETGGRSASAPPQAPRGTRRQEIRCRGRTSTTPVRTAAAVVASING